LTEFELIQQYFAQIGRQRDDVVVGVGDDAAVCSVPGNHELVVTTDLLIAGVHFPDNTPAHAIGYKALAVNLSDLAAMGATPAWFTMTLSLPESNASWLQEFSQGLGELADASGITLIGGDTTRGALAVGIQAYGFVATGSAILRSGARAGDCIFVTGHLGDAALGLLGESGELALSADEQKIFSRRLRYPTPRNQEGMTLRGVASAMIDVSDGLAADLGHILEASRVGASVRLMDLPVSPRYRDRLEQVGMDPALAGGDDYELCFTVPPERIERCRELAAAWTCGVAEIGSIEKDPGLRVLDEAGHPYESARAGYNHFSS